MQFRFDALTPGPYLPVSGIARTGVAWGRGPQRRFGGFMGVGIGPQADLSYSLGPVLELTLPLAGRFVAMMAGGYRPSYTFADWGAAVGGRISLAR